MPQLIFFAVVGAAAFFGYRSFVREAERVTAKVRRHEREAGGFGVDALFAVVGKRRVAACPEQRASGQRPDRSVRTEGALLLCDIALEQPDVEASHGLVVAGGSGIGDAVRGIQALDPDTHARQRIRRMQHTEQRHQHVRLMRPLRLGQLLGLEGIKQRGERCRRDLGLAAVALNCAPDRSRSFSSSRSR